MSLIRQNKFIYLAFLGCSLLLGFIFYQSRGVEGGLDSWEHYLISKSALKHPELLLHQWNKPVFTWCTVLFCQLGFNALILFNISCVLFSGLLIALAMKKQGYKNTWTLIPFIVFTPILLQNTISGLTEPLNILMLSLVLYFWSTSSFKTSVAIAGFLPFVRTEGFVICGAVFIMIILKKDYRLLLWLILGSFVLNLAGFIITHQPLWIITENPYWKQETEGKFDPGSGSFLHFFHQSRAMFGLPLELLLAIAGLLWIYMLYKRKPVNRIFLFSLLTFWLYFMAHTTIYYFGILGSHGLTRVMAVMAPAISIIAFITFDFFIASQNHLMRMVLFSSLTLWIIWTGYHETGYPKPHRIKEASVKPDKTQKNFIKAGDWLIEHNLMNRTIIHQSPYFDVHFNKDPYDIHSSYRIWSIDQNNDWAANGVIVIWDGFSALREGNMKLEWLQNNPAYKELHYIEGFEKPENYATMYDIHIFEKIGGVKP